MGSASTRSTTTNANAPQVSIQGSITSQDRTERRTLIPALRQAYTARAKMFRIIHMKAFGKLEFLDFLNKLMYNTVQKS